MSPSSPVTVEKKSNEVTLNCSVSTFPECPHKVYWLNDGTEVKDEENLTISHRKCSTSLKFLTSGVIHKPKLESLSCQIKDGYSGDVKPFPFIRRASGVEPDEKPGENVFKFPSTRWENLRFSH